MKNDRNEFYFSIKIFLLSIIFFVLVVLTLGCVSKNKAIDGKVFFPERESLESFQEQYNFLLKDTLENNINEHGYIFFIQHGEKKLGDSLLFSGIFLASIDCKTSAKTFTGIYESVKKRQGAAIRYEPMGNERPDDLTSRDMEDGFIFGLMHLWKNCPEYREPIKEIWSLHLNFLEKQNGYLIKESYKSLITPAVRYVIDLMTDVVYQKNKIDDSDLVNFETAALLTTISNVIDHNNGGESFSCYPLHLVLINVLTSELAGMPISKEFYDVYCEQTSRVNFLFADYFCKRKSAKMLLEQFKQNDFKYRWQRCEGEKDDNPELSKAINLKSDNLDFLFLYSLAKK